MKQGLCNALMLLVSGLFCSPSFAATSFDSALFGSETFYENSSGSPILSLIRSAQQSLDIEIYQMNDPLVHQEIRTAISRGVRVRVVQEDKPVGKSCHLFEPVSSLDDPSCKLQKDLVKVVRKAGGKYVAFNEALCGIVGKHCYEHGKMIIVDSKTVMISTGNFNITSLCNKRENPKNCNRDYTVVSRDSQVVATLLSVFEKDLRSSTSTRSDAGTGPIGTGRVTVSPYSLHPIVAFIRSAKKQIQIQNQYLEDPQMNAAIIEAAKRGVKVFVQVASVCSYGRPKETKANKFRSIFTAFDKAGVHSRIYTRRMLIKGLSGYLHAKAIVVDGERAWVGSVNGSTTSLSNNREFGIFLSEPEDVRKLGKFMYDDYVNPGVETWQESLVCKYDQRSSSGSGTPPEDDTDETTDEDGSLFH